MVRSRIMSFICGLLGLNAVIIVHEMGHFLACKLFNVATPIFSIGFGPVLAAYTIGTTQFQLSMLPFGGYVAINQQQLNAQPYWAVLIILSAGIVFNFVSAYLALGYVGLSADEPTDARITPRDKIRQILKRISKSSSQSDGVVGPIGIIGMISTSAALGFNYFILMLALLSINIGLFNLLPLPLLDGGQIAIHTINTLFGSVSARITDIISLAFFILMIVFFILVSFKDIRRLSR